MRRRAVATAATALAAVAVLAAAAPAHALPRLHAQRGAAPGVFTSDGRQVLLRGVNDNQLGDYYQQRPDLPSTVPLQESDFAQMRAMGMDVVRLIVHWSLLEPRRGAFDTAYLARIRQAVGWARRHGIYVVLDMHQDAWGKYIASPKGETCLPGFSRQQGWDGAPQWATLTDGLPTCRLSIREVAPAVAQAWQSFYDDREGIQSELVATWARLARAFAADPTVAGYDLLNEPNPGFAPAVTDASLLGAYYHRAIAAIRAAERSVRGGFGHIAFFEPGVIWSAAAADTLPPPPLVNDPNTVFAPHLYAESITADQTFGVTAVSIEHEFAIAQTAARTYGTTVWSGEWGWFGDPAADAPKIARYAAQEDAHVWGGAWWQWKQACGDPHDFADGDATQPTPVSGNLERFACPSGRPLPVPPTTQRLLSRPYVRFAPGRLQQLQSDPDTATATIRGSDPSPRGSCRLEAWVPSTGHAGRPVVRASGVRALRARRVPGGWVLSGCAHGDWMLRAAGWRTM